MKTLLDYISENFELYRSKLEFKIENNQQNYTLLINKLSPYMELLKKSYEVVDTENCISPKEEFYFKFSLLTRMKLLEKTQESQFSLTQEGVKILEAYIVYRKEKPLLAKIHKITHFKDLKEKELTQNILEQKEF